MTSLRFLVDMNVPASLCATLEGMGHSATHARSVGLTTATDDAIVEFAREHYDVIVTNDLDFTRILAVEGGLRPSLVLFRIHKASPSHLRSLLERHLESIVEALSRGSIVVVEESAVRIRSLPVGERME